MKAQFLGSADSPYILVYFDNGKIYKYSGIEYGQFYLLRKKFSRRIGKLVEFLKSKDYIRCERLEIKGG